MELGIHGISGRMGRAIAALAGEDAAITAVHGWAPDSEAALEAMLERSDIVIDFSQPAGLQALLQNLAAGRKLPLVTGTTGLSGPQQQMLEDYARRAPVLQSFNFSLGVNVLEALVERAAAVLGPQFDIEILEMHHRHKVDAPSGTALLLGEAAARGRGETLEALRQPAREGQTGPRKEGGIGFASLRGGDVIGEHSVMLAGERESITLSHHAASRDIFAAGAIHAAKWLRGKAAGRYRMQDALGL